MTPEAGSPQVNVANPKLQKTGRELMSQVCFKAELCTAWVCGGVLGFPGRNCRVLSVSPSRAATVPGKDLSYTLVSGLGVVGADECLGGEGGISPT